MDNCEHEWESTGKATILSQLLKCKKCGKEVIEFD